MQARLAEGSHFAAKSLDHADLIRLHGIEAVQHDQRGGRDQRGLHNLPAARDHRRKDRAGSI